MHTAPTELRDGEIDVDLTDTELYRHGFPHELFAELRRQGAVLRHPTVPMRRSPDGFGFWVVIGHPELQEAARASEAFSAAAGPMVIPNPADRSGIAMTSSDGDTHTRLRKLVSAGFTPRMIAHLEEQVLRRTTQILDGVAAAGGDCDLVRDLAYPLPMHIIADIVGMPDQDRSWVFSHTDRIMRSNDPRAGITLEERAQLEAELFAYAQRLGAEKRRNPADDVWSLLAAAAIEDERGGRSTLSDLELDMFFLVLSIAGSETTRNVISQGVRALLDHPEADADLRARDGVPDIAIEELIRWASPVTSFGRTVNHDTVLGGRDLRAGDRITMWFPSANFDERVFAEPFRLDLDRSPNRHVAFGGGGPHFCLGAHLARREIRTMFEQLLARTTHIERTGEPRWLATGPDAAVAVSLDRLPVRLHFRR